MDGKTRIMTDPDVVIGKPVIKGTRISVEFIIELLGRGAAVADIVDEYAIAAEDVQACLAYAGELLKAERIYVNPT